MASAQCPASDEQMLTYSSWLRTANDYMSPLTCSRSHLNDAVLAVKVEAACAAVVYMHIRKADADADAVKECNSTRLG